MAEYYIVSYDTMYYITDGITYAVIDRAPTRERAEQKKLAYEQRATPCPYGGFFCCSKEE